MHSGLEERCERGKGEDMDTSILLLNIILGHQARAKFQRQLETNNNQQAIGPINSQPNSLLKLGHAARFKGVEKITRREKKVGQAPCEAVYKNESTSL